MPRAGLIRNVKCCPSIDVLHDPAGLIQLCTLITGNADSGRNKSDIRLLGSWCSQVFAGGVCAVIAVPSTHRHTDSKSWQRAARPICSNWFQIFRGCLRVRTRMVRVSSSGPESMSNLQSATSGASHGLNLSLVCRISTLCSRRRRLKL